MSLFVYLTLYTFIACYVGLMGCRTNGLSDQWAVGPMGCRTNGQSPPQENGLLEVSLKDIKPSYRVLAMTFRKKMHWTETPGVTNSCWESLIMLSQTFPNSGRCYSLANSALVKGSILEGSDSLNFKYCSCGYNGNDMLNFEGNTIIISCLNCLCTWYWIISFFILCHWAMNALCLECKLIFPTKKEGRCVPGCCILKRLNMSRTIV